MNFTPDLLKQIVGTPFGYYTNHPSPPGLAIDGRTAALRILRSYIAELTFYRKGSKGGPNIPFRIRPQDFLIEWPDRPVDLQLPAIVCTPGASGGYEGIGIGTNFLAEETRDKYGPGTVLQRQAQYKEVFNLLILAGARAERRSILAGLETSLTPTENVAGLKLRMPEYYNRIACFTLNSRVLIDNAEESGEGRRTAMMAIDLRFETVALVSYGELQPPQFPDLGDNIGPEVVIDTDDPEV